MRANRLLSLAVLSLAACAGQANAPEPWERPDHTPPTVTDTSFCRNEGRRQAETLYPDRAPNDAVGVPRMPDDRRFPAEIRFYEQCMTRLGYVRASAAPAR
ncbi:MAG TPA: hypothetical protein VGJ56_02755 [Reyranella sp.]|jgi:hypothetical protein